MPATSRPTRSSRATEAARERCEENGRAIDRVAKSLEAAQADLTALRGTLGEGAGDLRKDLAKLLRDARRDVGKMSKAVRRDLDRVKKDLSTASPRPARSRRASRGSASPKPRSGSRRRST